MEKSNTKYDINAFCEFKDKEVEKDYLDSERDGSLKTARQALLLIGIIFFMLFIYDYFYNTSELEFMRSFIARLAVLTFCIITYFVTDKAKSNDTRMLFISMAELALYFGYMYILLQQQAQGFLQQSMAVMLLVMVAFIAPNRWIYSIITASIIAGSFILLAPMYIRDIEFTVRIESTIYLLVCLVFSALFSYSRNHTMRSEYTNLKKYESLSVTDCLTGIYNRGKFEGFMRENIHKVVDGTSTGFALLLLDIDDFKSVNDTHGHGVGDNVLKELTVVVKSNIRNNDIFARWGGEEFTLLFPDLDMQRGIESAERIRKACFNHEFSGHGNITVSIGVAVFVPGDTESSLMKRADDMMYEAKRQGKNRVASDAVSIGSSTKPAYHRYLHNRELQ